KIGRQMHFLNLKKHRSPLPQGERCCYVYASFALIASISMEILTSSPTSTPPVSNVLFQVNPNSLRLIFPVALNPATSSPHGFLPTPANVALNVTGFVTP